MSLACVYMNRCAAGSTSVKENDQIIDDKTGGILWVNG